MIANKFDRRRFLTIASAAAVSSCSRKPAVATVDKPLIISINNRTSMAGFHVAMENGYFQQAGIPIDAQVMGRGDETIPLLAAGKIDMTFGSLSMPLVNGIARGLRMKVVAGREITQPGCSEFGVLYLHRDFFPQGITSMAQLKGKPIATSGPLSMPTFALDVMLSNEGLKLSDVDVKTLPGAGGITALRAKQVQAVVTQHNYGPPLNERFPEFVPYKKFVEILPGFQYAFILFGARLLDGPVDIGGRFLAAYLRGCTDYVGGATPKWLDQLAESNGVDPVKARSFCREVAVPDGVIKEDSLTYYNRWAVGHGHTDRMVPVNDFVDKRFLDYAHQHPFTPKKS